MCRTPNDEDHVFCKACGSKRVNSPDQTLSPDVIQSINDRIQYLDKIVQSSNYSRQKSKLEVELTEFLSRLQAGKTLYNAIPDDVRRFVTFKETQGRTQLHTESCVYRGAPGKQKCACPVTMTSKSVDSLVGKLRAIFRDLGRTGEWSDLNRQGNPASSMVFKRHIKALQVEQASHAVPIKKAIPLMFDKLGSLCRYLSYQCTAEPDPVAKFLFMRDRAYFAFVAHSGDRANDLGNIALDRLFCLPADDGIFVSQVRGKTFDINHPNNFVIKKSMDSDICPIRHLRCYMLLAHELKIDLNQGYLFRIRDNVTRQIVNKPVTANLMADRLKTHLCAIHMYDGESAHSHRRACAITLTMLGLPEDSVNDHVGWRSQGMLAQYANIGNLCGPNSVASRLSEASARQGSNNSSQLEDIAQRVTSLSQLKKFRIE